MKFFAILALAMSFNAFAQTEPVGYNDGYVDGYDEGYNGYIMEFHFGATINGEPCNVGLETSPENPNLYAVMVDTPRITAVTSNYTGELKDGRINVKSVRIQNMRNKKVTVTDDIRVVMAANGEPAAYTVQQTVKTQKKILKIFNVENVTTGPKAYCTIGV